LTATDKRWLVRRVTSGKADDAVQLTRQLRDIINMECSVWTTRRALKEAGLKVVTKKKGRDFCLAISAGALLSP
jgi:hypothetical protein